MFAVHPAIRSTAKPCTDQVQEGLAVQQGL